MVRCFYGVAVVFAAAVFGSCFSIEEAEDKPAVKESSYAITAVVTEGGQVTVPSSAAPGVLVTIRAVPLTDEEDDFSDQEGGGD
jgi:hypothetical protein